MTVNFLVTTDEKVLGGPRITIFDLPCVSFNLNSNDEIISTIETLVTLGMGRTWEKFSSLPAKKWQKFETATGKENF